MKTCVICGQVHKNNLDEAPICVACLRVLNQKEIKEGIEHHGT